MKDAEAQSKTAGEIVEVPQNIQGKSLRSEPSAIAADSAESGTQGRAIGGQYVSEFAGDVHAYVREFIALGDQKAGFLFAVVSAMLAYLHANGISDRWLRDVRSWDFGSVLAFVSVIGLVVGAISSILAVLPRLGGDPEGLVFWESVATKETGEHYARQVKSSTDAQLADQRLRHVHELAKVCKAKYRRINVAMWTGGVGLAASVLYLALVSRGS